MTTFEASFDLVGLDVPSKRALIRIDEVIAKKNEICGSLAEKASIPLAQLDWAGGFPSGPDQKAEYEEMSVCRLTPIMLGLVAKEIESVLIDLHSSDHVSPNVLAEKFEEYLESNNSELSNSLISLQIPLYELRYLPNACVVYDDVHICSTSVFTTVPSKRLELEISHEQSNFRFSVESEIKIF